MTGRPTDYNEEVLEKAREYLASCVDTVEEGKVQVNLPSAEGLALHLDVSRKTLYNWADKHEAFLHILEEMNQLQAQKLINNGLSGRYNPTIAKLVLAKHGYKDSSETDLTSKGEQIQPVLVKFLDGKPNDN